MSGQLHLFSMPGYRTPQVGADGVLRSAGAIAVMESLSRGSLDGVMDVLDVMPVSDLATTLREAGFRVSRGAEERGKEAVLSEIERNLIEAVRLRADGFEVAAAQGLGSTVKDAGTGRANANGAEYDNDSALAAIQAALADEWIQVELLGDAVPQDRASLMFIAGQGVEKGVQGFAFEGISGKFAVPMSLQDVTELHSHAAGALAEEHARAGLGTWAQGTPATGVSELVPDSVRRLLRGSLSMASAQAITAAIEGGSIREHAAAVGAHTFARVLGEQGVDTNAPTVEALAEEKGLRIKPMGDRSKYPGPVVGTDHKGALVKVSRDEAIVIPFADLPADVPRPKSGDMVMATMRNGALSVVAQERGQGLGRGR